MAKDKVFQVTIRVESTNAKAKDIYNAFSTFSSEYFKNVRVTAVRER